MARCLALSFLWLGLCGWAAGGAPVVGQTPDPALGGLRMIVAGDGFVAGKTRFRLWSPEWKAEFAEKDETKRLLGYLGQPEPPLPDRPGAAFVDCQVIRCTDSLAAVEFPQYGPWSGPRTGSYFAVLYAGDDKDGWSKPWALNRTEAHMLDRDAAAPGDFVRIFGRKLQAMHAPLPLIALVPRGGGRPIACPTQDIYYQHQHYIANYSCQFSVPADTPEGGYEVRAHNHTGEAWGWSEPLPLDVRKPGSEPKLIRAASLDQKVLDEAGKSAPAVLVLPPGTFALTETLVIPPGVTLRGSGMHNTILRPSETPPFRTRQIDGLSELAAGAAMQVTSVMVWGRTDFALEDLMLWGGEQGRGVLLAVVDGRGRVTQHARLRRCWVRGAEAGQGVLIGRARRLAVDHCKLTNVGIWALELRDAYVGFNEFENLHQVGGTTLGWGRGSTNVVVEHNAFLGRGGIVGPGGARNLLVAGNSVRAVEGDASAVQGAEVRWSGPAKCHDASSLLTPGTRWGTASDGQEGDLTGHVVVVVAGRGVGQWREIADARGETVRLARPFAVVPDHSSRLRVARGSVANTFVCNMAYGCSGGAGGFLDAGAINGIVEGSQVVESGPAVIQSGPSNAPNLYNQIVHCRFFSGQGIRLAAEEGDHCAGNQLGTVVARNEILRLRKGCPAAIAVCGPSRFAAIEGNRISDCSAAVSISTRSVGTLVRRNRMMGIARGPVLDQGIESIVTGFTDKAGFHDFWPQGLNVLEVFRGALPKPEEKR